MFGLSSEVKKMREIVKELKKVGAKCRKKRGEEEYVCIIEGTGTATVVITPYTTKIKLQTDEEVTEFYYEFGIGNEESADRVEDYLKENLGADFIDIVTEGRGRGARYEVYVIGFDTDEADPAKIAKIAKNIAEKDIWVDLRYRMRIVPKIGDRRFESEDEFIKELLS